MIDASTCLFPDQTWFVKGLKHSDNVKAIEYMINCMIEYDGQATTETLNGYSQFSSYSYESGTIVALSESEEKPKIFDRLALFFKDFFRLISKVVAQIINKLR